jgi:hypothetical protein
MSGFVLDPGLLVILAVIALGELTHWLRERR